MNLVNWINDAFKSFWSKPAAPVGKPAAPAEKPAEKPAEAHTFKKTESLEKSEAKAGSATATVGPKSTDDQVKAWDKAAGGPKDKIKIPEDVLCAKGDK